MTTREPRTVGRIRKSATHTAEVAILLKHIDTLTAELDRYENLDLPDEAILATAGPSTSEIGGKDLWELGERDLLRLARDLLTAAIRSRQAP